MAFRMCLFSSNMTTGKWLHVILIQSKDGNYNVLYIIFTQFKDCYYLYILHIYFKDGCWKVSLCISHLIERWPLESVLMYFPFNSKITTGNYISNLFQRQLLENVFMYFSFNSKMAAEKCLHINIIQLRICQQKVLSYNTHLVERWSFVCVFMSLSFILKIVIRNYLHAILIQFKEILQKICSCNSHLVLILLLMCVFI